MSVKVTQLMPDIRCETCKMLKVVGRATKIYKNTNGPRAKCFCGHKDAASAFDMRNGGNGTEPCFISYTDGRSDKPTTKTTPRWCPVRLMLMPVEVTKAEAYRVLSSKTPRGMFYIRDGGEVIGINNLRGEAELEGFKTKNECLRWLMGKANSQNLGDVG